MLDQVRHDEAGVDPVAPFGSISAMERVPCVYLFASGFHGTLYTGVTSGAKRAETRAKRLAELIAVSAEGRRLPQYEWRKKS